MLRSQQSCACNMYTVYWLYGSDLIFATSFTFYIGMMLKLLAERSTSHIRARLPCMNSMIITLMCIIQTD